ncbi:MAG: RNA polymerase sigma factor [Planctomycetota bacterium]
MSQIDAAEFARLFDEAYPRLWTIAAAIVNDRDLAQDIVQESAMTGLRRLADYQPGTNFGAWMGQIVRFTALNSRRSATSRKMQAVETHQFSETVEGDAAETDEPIDRQGRLVDDQQDFDDEVARAIDALDPERRSCLLLRVVHNLSYQEISEQLGVPEGTAMSHVHRAKSSMRKALSADAPAPRGEEGGRARG